MRHLIVLLALSIVSASAQWSSFYITPTGDPRNGGSDENASPKASGANGNWNATTGAYIFAGATDLSAVTTNDVASFFADGGVIAEYTAWITNVNDGTDTIMVSMAQSKSGTAPGTAATGISCRIGGAWLGQVNFSTNYHPWRASTTWPYSYIGVGLTNPAGFPVMLWAKGNGDTNVSDYQMLGTTNTGQGPFFIQGYTNTVGDGGFARLDFTNTIANTGLSPMAFSGTGGAFLKQLYFTGGGDAVAGSTHNNGLVNCTTFIDVDTCIFTEAWETALRMAAGGSSVRRSLFLNNQHNAASGKAAIEAVNPSHIYQNTIGDQNYRAGDNGCDGIALVLSGTTPVNIEENIIYNLWGTGINQSGNTANVKYLNNAIYKTTLYGIWLPTTQGGSTNQSDFRLENNIVVQAHTGIRGHGSNFKFLFAPFVQNNAFLQCTNGNVVNILTNRVSGSIQLSANPWVDPDDGDFALNNTAGGGAALRGFTYNPWMIPTTTYRDIGPVQHQDSGGAGGTRAYIGQ